MMMKKISQKQYDSFLEEVGKLDAPNFIGLVRMCNVSLLDEEGEPKPFHELLGGVLDRFCKSKRAVRKDLIAFLKVVNKEG